MNKRRQEWIFRLKQEYKASMNAFFITLTYDDANVPEVIDETTGEYCQTVNKRDFQLFMKIIRDKQSKLTDIKIRYYCVGEYGTKTKRPHYHAILFNTHFKIIENLNLYWKLGHTHTGKVTDGSIHYVTKYHVNRNLKPYEACEDEFTLQSTRPGIGYQYIIKNSKWHIENANNYVIDNGFKKTIPRYYKRKIFSEDTQKAISKIAMLDSLWNDKIEVERLKQLGIEDANMYMYDSNMEQSKKVKRKNNNENDLF